MSVNNGNPANETTFNNAYLSRTSDSDTIGKIDLNNADSTPITDVQTTVNDQRTDIDQNRADIDTNDTELADHESRISTNETDIAAIQNDYVDLDSAQSVAGEKTFSDNMVIDANLTVNGTQTILNTETLEVEDNNIVINNGGDDTSSEGAGITVERTGTDAELLYKNALENKFEIGETGDLSEVAGIIKDTEANIQTIVTPSTSRRYYATDTGKHFIYDALTSSFLEIGSGSGSGAPSIYQLFNAEDEDVTGFSNVTTSGTTPISGDFSYLVSTYPATFPAVTLDPRNLEKTNSVRLHCSITSGTAKLIIKDQSANVIAEIEFSSSDVTPIVLDGYINSTVTSLQLEITDVSSAGTLKLDDVVFDDSPWIYKNLIDSQYWEQLVDSSTFGSTSTTIPVLNSPSVQRGSGVFEVLSDGTDGTRFKILRNNTQITLSAAATFNSTNQGLVIRKDGSEIKRVFNNSATSSHEGICLTIEQAQVDEIYTVERSGAANPLTFESVHIAASSQSEYVVTPSKSSLTKWKEYTPATQGFGTLASGEFLYREIGGSVEIKGRFTAGTSTATEAQVGLPNSYTVDSGITGPNSAGVYFTNRAANNGGAILISADDSFVNFGANGTFNSTAIGGLVISQGDGTGSNEVLLSGGIMSFHCSVPVNELDPYAQFLAAIPIQETAYINVDATHYVENLASTTANKTRTLVDIDGDSFFTIGSNQLVLPAGKFSITLPIGSYSNTNGVYFRFRNITDASDYKDFGLTSYSAGDLAYNMTTVHFDVDIESAKTFEFQTKADVASGEEMIGRIKIVKIR